MKLSLQSFYTHLACVSIAGNILLVYMLKNHLTVRMPPQNRSTEHETGFSVDPVDLNQDLNSSDTNLDTTSMRPTEDRTGKFTFLLNPRNTCSWKRKNVNTSRFAVVVVSKIDNFVLRFTIRKTWGSFDRKLGSLVFLVGTTSDQNVQKQLLKESTLYNDVIQVNVTDAYNLLTYKSIAMLEWLHLFCRNADLYFKTDDDVFLNMEKLISTTGKFRIKRFFMCFVFKNARPIRNKKSKWYVPLEQYDGEFYPTYCSGPAYIFSSSILQDLYKSALTSKFCAMEDVYITGISARNLHLKYIHSGKFIYDWRSKSVGCDAMHMYSLHNVDPSDLLNLYSFTTRNRQICG